jgi:hypothetical protein
VLDKFKTFFGVSPEAAKALPPPAPIKTKSKQVSLPSFFTSATPSKTSAIPRSDNALLNADITALRSTSRNSREAVRNFVAASPDLSAAVFAYIRMAVSQTYTAVAYSSDGRIDVDATKLVQQILSRMEHVGDYTAGFSQNPSIRSSSESLAKELMLYGSASLEVIFDKALTPSKLQPISVTNIDFIADGLGVRPVQIIGSETRDLDTPAFIYTSLDQDLLSAYSTSPLEPALQPTLFGHELLNDIRRIVRRVLFPRLKAVVDEDKFRANLPAEIQFDPEKLNEYMTSFILDLETRLNNLAPEEALIYFDTLDLTLESRGNDSLGDELKVLQSLIDGKTASGSKALGAILGHGAASSNIASTEAALFLKSVQGAVQAKLNELYSRALTVAVRVMGVDVSVQFKYADIDLRPAAELVAFHQTKQAMVLEQLSLGLITDEEASIQLTGHLPPEGYKPLSGTMFKSKQEAQPTDQSSNNGSTLNQNLNSDAPAQGRGGNTKRNPVKAVDNIVQIA